MMGDIDRIQHEATRSDSGAGGEGMLIVETIARIRREFYIKGKAIKEIVRDLRVSRNKVRKVLRSGATSFEYEREVQPRPKLEACRGGPSSTPTGAGCGQMQTSPEAPYFSSPCPARKRSS
jgi:hypothetical protein